MVPKKSVKYVLAIEHDYKSIEVVRMLRIGLPYFKINYCHLFLVIKN